MAPHRLRLPVLAAQLVGAATLVRSIAYDRWITVVVSLLLVAGSVAAWRGRAWGPVLAFAAAVAFPAFFLLGMAPPWFVLAGVVAAWPFAAVARGFSPKGNAATALLVGLAGSLGAGIAVFWRMFALSLFETFPSLIPSFEANHGILSALVAALAAYGVGKQLRAASDDGVVRVAERVRVAEPAAAASDLDAELERDALAELEDAPPLRARRG